MRHRLIRLLIVTALVAAAFIGFRSISHYHNKLEVQQIELKSNQLKARTLEMEYDQALKKLDAESKDKNSTQQQLKDAQDQLQQLEQQKKDLEAQLQAKLDSQKKGVVYAAAAPSSSACGDNSYAQYIYKHESGCSTTSINSYSGACGIGQALPCSKMGCSLGDYDCQNKFFTAYAIARYGSWSAAYSFWVANHYW